MFGPQGDRVVTATADGVVRLWHVEETAEPIVFAGHLSAVNAVAWSPDGGRFVTASDDGTAIVWSTEAATEPIVLEGHASPVVAASWSPGGDRVLTASRDGTARIWRADTADLIAAIKAATRVCLTPEFREKHLGDAPEEASRHHLACASRNAGWQG